MPVTLVCPSCNRSLTAPDGWGGQVIGCPHCRRPVAVPAPAPVAQATPAAADDSEPVFPCVRGGYTRDRLANYNGAQTPMIVIAAAWVVVCLGGPLMVYELGKRAIAELNYIVGRQRNVPLPN